MMDRTNKIKETYKILKLYSKIIRLYPCTFNIRGSRRVLNAEVVESLKKSTKTLKTSKNTLESFIRFYCNSTSYIKSFKEFLVTFTPEPKIIVENGKTTYHHMAVTSYERLLENHIKCTYPFEGVNP